MNNWKALISKVEANWTITSPNNWLVKAWAYIEHNKLILPHDCLIVLMTTASRAVEDFEKFDDYQIRLEKALIISLTVRMAEKAFFHNVAKLFNDKSAIKICTNCLMNNLYDNSLKKYRRICNEKIIHKMETEIMVNPKDLNFSILYYNEIFTLPLMDPITWEKKTISLCKKCLKNNNMSSKKTT